MNNAKVQQATIDFYVALGKINLLLEIIKGKYDR
jgi:hypothetical protein